MPGDYWKDKYLNTALEVSRVYATSGGFVATFYSYIFFPIVAFRLSSTTRTLKPGDHHLPETGLSLWLPAEGFAFFLADDLCLLLLLRTA